MAFGNPSFGKGGLHRPQADINVTPLVDVMLVLLIVFMITAPMLAQGLKVDLPQAKTAQPINPKDPIVVSVTKDGRVAVAGDEMDISDLPNVVLGKMEGDKSRVIQVRADREANYGAIVNVLDELASNGLTHIALVSDPKSRGAAGAPARSSDRGDLDKSASIARAAPVIAGAR